MVLGLGRSLRGLSRSDLIDDTYRNPQDHPSCSTERDALKGLWGEEAVASSPGRVDGVDGAGQGPPELLRGRSCQTLTEWKEKPEEVDKGTVTPGSQER